MIYINIMIIDQYNNIEMYSTDNKGKFVVAEKLYQNLKKNYKYVTSVSENVYIDKLDAIVNK